MRPGEPAAPADQAHQRLYRLIPLHDAAGGSTAVATTGPCRLSNVALAKCLSAASLPGLASFRRNLELDALFIVEPWFEPGVAPSPEPVPAIAAFLGAPGSSGCARSRSRGLSGIAP
jgi:hypothetical protein